MRVCQRGGGKRGAGCGDRSGGRRWMTANILPACYMQMPNISKTKYKVEGRKMVITLFWLYFDYIYLVYTSSAFGLSHKIIRVLLRQVLVRTAVVYNVLWLQLSVRYNILIYMCDHVSP